MGIDVYATGRFPKARILRAKGQEALTLVEASARAWAKPFGPLYAARVEGDTLWLSLFPFAGDIEIGATPQGITARFRSSNLGAGFHVAAVELLEHLDQKHAIGWAWADETGYAPGHNIAALEQAMADFVGVLARFGDAMGSFCLDTALAGARPGRIGPMGPLGASFAPQDLQPWPEPGLTAQTWTRLLRAALWQGPWGPPLTDEDEREARVIRHCAERAGPLHEDLAVALAEWQGAQTICPRPQAQGIGYRRGMLRRELVPGLTMELPGQAAPAIEDGELRFLHADFWLGILHAEVKPGFAFPPAFPGPDIAIGDIAMRKGKMATGSASVAIFRPVPHDLVILTLASTEPWVREALDDWLATLLASDVFT